MKSYGASLVCKTPARINIKGTFYKCHYLKLSSKSLTAFLRDKFSLHHFQVTEIDLEKFKKGESLNDYPEISLSSFSEIHFSFTLEVDFIVKIINHFVKRCEFRGEYIFSDYANFWMV